MRVSQILLIASLCLSAALAIALLKGCNCDCPDAVVTKVWTDTIHVTVADVKPSIVVKVPEAFRVVHKSPALLVKVLPHPLAEGSVFGSGSEAPAPVFSPCNETVVYSDTTEEPDAYRAIIEDTLTGNRIAGRKISFWNLSPKITEHVEKTIPLKERVRIYLGLSVGFEASYKDKKVSNFNVGPEVVLTEPHGVMIGYGYDAKNNGHRLEFLYKIKLKK